MRLGIDLGTTRIVVAAADRGNYPVLVFECQDGEARDWFTPIVAVRGNERRYGWEAWASMGEPGWTTVRSIKRFLGESGPATCVNIADQSIPMNQLLAELVAALKTSLLDQSSLNASRREVLEVMLGVPANANSNQRFLTAEAFRQEGFLVMGILNEPSAASIEFGHRRRLDRHARRRECILVYDFGGGTFDTSLVELEEDRHTVLDSSGIEFLGGDDFDEKLADAAMEAAGIPHDVQEGLSQAEWFRLMEECRQKKEALQPNTRKIVVDLDVAREGWGEVTLMVADFNQRCRPLIDMTIKRVEDMLLRHGLESEEAQKTGQDEGRRLEALYLTGGASELPVVARCLRERFGRKVHRSVQARAATAVGLAIQADTESGYVLRDKFSRYFGVWREADGGKRIVFDTLFAKGAALPLPGETPLQIRRSYFPVHNIGHFRYLECSNLNEAGEPAGDITFWDDIRFPFSPDLCGEANLEKIPVRPSSAAAEEIIQEDYCCDTGGALRVIISNESSGYRREYPLGRWSASSPPVKPGRKKKISLSP